MKNLIFKLKTRNRTPPASVIKIKTEKLIRLTFETDAQYKEFVFVFIRVYS